MNILAILTCIANEPSRNNKQAIIEKYKDNSLLKEVFKAAYDPTINYYIKKIPDYNQTSTPTSDLAEAVFQLDIFSTRKVTGDNAKYLLSTILSTLSADDAYVIKLIIDRDLKCGCTASTANKVWKNLIPEFPYMRVSLPKAVKLDKWDWKNGIFSQLKADGQFANLDIVSDTEVYLTSRSGSKLPIDKFKAIVDCAIKHIPYGYRLHGELNVERNGILLPREIGNGIITSVLKGGDFAANEVPIYSVWDAVLIDRTLPLNVLNVSYETRWKFIRNSLFDSFVIRPIDCKVVYSLDEAYQHYFSIIDKGFEGTIIKNKSGVWADNTSKDACKLKVECTVELKVVGYNPGNGKHSNTLGSLICRSSDDMLEVNVGSGINDALRAELFSNIDNVIGSIISVKFNNITYSTKANKLHSLFLPIYIELRDDKNDADSFIKIQEQFNSLIKL